MTLREALVQLYERDGRLTARSFVEEARTGKGPIARRLKDALPWDAERALYAHQLETAAKLIRKYRVVYKPTPRSGLRSTRAFVSIDRPTGRTYVPVEELAQDPFESQMALRAAEREWRQLKAKYANLQGFIEMVQRDLGENAA